MAIHIKYYTSKGSIYIHTLDDKQDFWMKEDADGGILTLAEGLHISIKKLQRLIKQYPSAVLDKTYCFDEHVEKEFFDDVKREKVDVQFEAEDTVIFFIIKSQSGLHTIGCSSPVRKIEKVDV